MSDQKENGVSYDEVIGSAQAILKKGERYSIEKIQENLGKGSRAQVAEMLKKWQINKNQKHRNKTQGQNKQQGQGQNQGKQQQGRNQNQQRPRQQPKNTNTNKNQNQRKQVDYHNLHQDFTETYRKKAPSEPFSEKRLEAESTVVNALFWAIHEVKKKRAEALEVHQQKNSAVMSMRMKVDKDVIQIKKEVRQKLNVLQEEYAKTKTLRERALLEFRNNQSQA